MKPTRKKTIASEHRLLKEIERGRKRLKSIASEVKADFRVVKAVINQQRPFVSPKPKPQG